MKRHLKALLDRMQARKLLTTKYKTYTFEQLSNKAQEKIVDNFSHDVYLDFMVDDFVERLAKRGFKNVKIFYSGFYSQGDGLSFTANFGNVEIYRSGSMYYHEFTMYCDNKRLQSICRFIAREFHRELQTEYELQTSVEAIKETCESNNYRFDKNGNLIN